MMTWSVKAVLVAVLLLWVGEDLIGFALGYQRDQHGCYTSPRTP